MRFLPSFVLHTLRSLGQVKQSHGFLDGNLLADRKWTFWTMTLWDEQENMRRYMTSGAHKATMPSLLHWCDEASVVHWEQSESALPSWTEADRRMRASGRPSKVRNPSPQHATLSFHAPRLSMGGPIKANR
jgi:heme-degrading monooxygenase HmoA